MSLHWMVYLNIGEINKDWDRTHILHLNNFNPSKRDPFPSVFLAQFFQVSLQELSLIAKLIFWKIAFSSEVL